jgi:hypothetical protein
MPAPTLEGRLLCASVCCYAITGDGVLNIPATDFYATFAAGAGFAQPPVAFVGGDDLIDACLVGTLADGVVLAFRGTLPFDIHSHQTLLDWLNDFNADPVNADGYPGTVHSGFLGALTPLRDRLVAEVQRQRVGPAAAQPLLITGHSKGGAMAPLAAWRLHTALGIPVKVVTFAGARPGNLAFESAYDALIDHTRYEYADDIVPHLPPSQDGFLAVLSSLPLVGPRFAGLKRFDYKSVGTLRFIDWTGQIEGDSTSLEVERTLSLVSLIVRARFAQIGSDHAVVCGSGYMTAVCPTGVCPRG